MADPSEVNVEEAPGVFYATEHYAGIPRRLFIMVIDGFALVLLASAAFALMAALKLESPGWEAKAACAALLLWYVYMAVLKITPLGTLGYRLAGVRLVSIYGRTPSIWQTSLRFAFLLVGPLNPIFDIVWLGGEVDRQSLRDKFAMTYVVRRGAKPMGHGRARFEHRFLLGWAFLFREVEREPSIQHEH